VEVLELELEDEERELELELAEFEDVREAVEDEFCATTMLGRAQANATAIVEKRMPRVFWDSEGLGCNSRS
jgi:hypothetical protein